MQNLSDREISLIRRYTVMSKLIMPSFLASCFQPILWMLQVMLDDLFFEAEHAFIPGLDMMLILTVICLVIFSTCSIAAMIGTRKQEWQDIVQKVQCDSVNTIPGQIAIESRSSQNPREISRILHMAHASAKIGKALILILPALVLVGFFLPELMHSYRQKELRIQQIMTAQQEISSAFKRELAYTCSADDPRDRGTENCGLFCRPDEDSMSRHVMVKLDSHGVVTEIVLKMDLNEELTLEANKEKLSSMLSDSVSALENSGVSAVAHLMDRKEISDDLLKACLNDSSGFSSVTQNGIRMTLSFHAADGDLDQTSVFYLFLKQN